MATNRGRGDQNDFAETQDMANRGAAAPGMTTEHYGAASPAPSVRRETVRRAPGALTRRGGTYNAEIPEAYNLDRDRVRWGPIWAGLITALTTLLLLSLLGLAIGLTTANAGEAVARGTGPANAGRNSAIWGSLSALVAFLLGGYVTGRSEAIFNRRWGAFNGALVFLVAVPILLYLASKGLGAVTGTLGTFAQGLNVDPNQARNTAQTAAEQARQAAQNVTPGQAADAAIRARDSAWLALGGTLVGLVSSALGGALGTRREVMVDTTGGQERITD